MSNKKINGFTLTELLVVLAILAILAVMLVPKINVIINNSKEKLNKSSVVSLSNEANNYYSKYTLDKTKNTAFNGTTNLIDYIEFSGKKPEKGYVFITKDGEIFVSAMYENKCYVKDFDDEEASISNDNDLCNH